MSYKLMIKQHKKTKLKYLCITQIKDYLSYSGSGSYWLKHLKKHGYNFTTELLFKTDNYNEFVEVCLQTSEILNVALSEEFANLIPEQGYGNSLGKSNLTLFWEYVSIERKRDIILRRNKKIKENHYSKNNETKKRVSDIISEKNIKRWEKMVLEERREIIERMREGNKVFHQNKKNPKYIAWKKAISKTMKSHFIDVGFELISLRNKNARLNLSEAKKLKRKQKIQEVYAGGKHDKLFERYSKERLGSNNPNAKQITIDNIIYGSVQEASRKTGIPAYQLYKKRKIDEKNKINKTN